MNKSTLRRIQAKDFLDNALLPELRRNADLAGEQVLSLLEAYRQAHPGPGNDFDLEMVIGRVLQILMTDNPAYIDRTGQPLPEIALYRQAWHTLLLTETDPCGCGDETVTAGTGASAEIPQEMPFPEHPDT